MSSATENIAFLLNSKANVNIIDNQFSSPLLFMTKLFFVSNTKENFSLLQKIFKDSDEFIFNLSNTQGRCVFFFILDAAESGLKDSKKIFELFLNEKKFKIQNFLLNGECFQLFLVHFFIFFFY